MTFGPQCVRPNCGGSLFPSSDPHERDAVRCGFCARPFFWNALSCRFEEIVPTGEQRAPERVRKTGGKTKGHTKGRWP